MYGLLSVGSLCSTASVTRVIVEGIQQPRSLGSTVESYRLQHLEKEIRKALELTYEIRQSLEAALAELDSR